MSNMNYINENRKQDSSELQSVEGLSQAIFNEMIGLRVARDK